MQNFFNLRKQQFNGTYCFISLCLYKYKKSQKMLSRFYAVFATVSRMSSL